MTKYLVMRVWITGREMHVDLWNNEQRLGVELSLRHYGSLREFLHYYLMISEPIAIDAIMYLYKECIEHGHI